MSVQRWTARNLELQEIQINEAEWTIRTCADFNCLRTGHHSKYCKSRTCSVPNCGRRHNKLLKEGGYNKCLRCYDSSSNNDHTRRTPCSACKMVKGNHSLSVLAMCDTGSSISFADKSKVSTMQLQGQKASLSKAGIHGSQDVKKEIVPIAVSARKKSQPLITVQFYVHEKLNLGDQIVDPQRLKKRYPHLENLPNQSYNLNEVQVVLGQDCYDIHKPLEIKKSEDKAELCAVKSKVGGALSGPLATKQTATLATTTSVSVDKLANQLSK